MNRIISLIVLCMSLHVFAVDASPHYKLAICAIFKDEGPYLKEWLEFHKIQGVEHFFLYNNNSTDEYRAILEPYIQSNEVTLIDWLRTYETAKKRMREQQVPWVKVQVGAYNNCLAKYGSLTEWLAVIDIDEFLFCPDGTPLVTFLESYKEYGGLCANWLLFGTSHLENIPPGKLMIEALLSCAPEDEWRNTGTKSIIQPRHVLKCANAHAFIYKDGYFAVNANFDPAQDNQKYSLEVVHDKIRINHYWTRAEAYFRAKKIPSRQGRRAMHGQKAMEDLAKHYNDCVDTTILQFAPKLRENIGFIE